MIDRDITVTVKGRTATLSEEIFVYKNDGAIKYYFNVIDYAYRFSTENMIARAVIKTSNMTILKPNGDSFKTLRKPVVGDTVEFDLSKDLIDEANEVGDYQIQIHLFDLQDNRITIPAFKITVLDTIADVPEPNLAVLNASYADKSYLSKEESHIEGPFQPGDLLTADNLNALHKFTLDTCEGTRDYIDQGLAQIKGEKEEIINARGGLHYLKLRLERDKEEVLQIMREDLYKSFKGERISADKSVKGVTKDMVIEGRTYQNLVPNFNTHWTRNSAGVTINNDRKLTIVADGMKAEAMAIRKNFMLLKSNTVYTVVANITQNTLSQSFNLIHLHLDIMCTKNSVVVEQGITGIVKGKFTTIDDISLGDRIEINVPKDSTGTVVIEDFMILEGDWTNKEVPPYFEGIHSAGEAEINLLENNMIYEGYIGGADGMTFTYSSNTTSIIYPCEPNTTYTVVKEFVTDRFVVATTDTATVTNQQKVNILNTNNTGLSSTVTTPSNAKYLIAYVTKNTSSEPCGRLAVYKSTQSHGVENSKQSKISISSSNKNLFNVKEFCNSSGNKEYYESDGDTLIVKKLDGRSGGFDFIQKIEKNTNYYLSCDELSSRRIYLSKDKINWTSATFSTYFNSDENEYVTFKFVTNNFPTNLNVMLEKGTQPTSYEPYKEDKKEILLKEPGTMMYHPEISQGTIQATPDSTIERDDATRVRTGWFKCNNEKPFTVYGLTSTQKVAVLYFNEKKTNIGWTDWQNSVENKTLPSECVYARAIFANRDNSSCAPEDFSATFIDVFAIIPCLDGLKGLPSGICDTVESREDGIYFVKRVGKDTLKGSNNEIITKRNEGNSTTTISFNIEVGGKRLNNDNIICNKLIVDRPSSNGIEGIGIGDSNEFYIEILRSKLLTQDISGFRAWLQTNPVMVYYELAEPIEIKLYDYYSTNLQTYKDVTYIQGDNFILPEISCEIPVKEQPVS